MNKTLNEMARDITHWREQKGFITKWENMPEKLMLVVTEVSEAMEAYRDDNMINFKEELADTIIRVLDICAALTIDIEGEILKKMSKNMSRPYKHGRRC